MKDPHTLWNKLKERYDHLKLVHLPEARYDWIHLRLQFKIIQNLFKIVVMWRQNY